MINRRSWRALIVTVVFFIVASPSLGERLFSSLAPAKLPLMPAPKYPAQFTSDVFDFRGNKLSAIELREIRTGAEPPIHIEVTDNHILQQMQGYGANLTESCIINFQTLSVEQQTQFLHDVFSNEAAGFSFLRIPAGSNDFSDPRQRNYSYDDTPENAEDAEFKYLSLGKARDLIEMIRAARKVNPGLRLMLSPWSAPAWMKDSKKLEGGTLLEKHYASYARYLALVLKEFARQGIEFAYISLVNEPAYANPWYPSMGLSPEQQIVLIRDFVAPEFARESLKTQILIHDHNWDLAEDVNKILDTKGIKEVIGGVAYHCYGGNMCQMLDSIRKHPTIPTLQTECTGFGAVNEQGDFHWWLENQVVGAANIGTSGAMGWNLCLDEKSGPKNGGCQNCRGMVTIDHSTKEPQLVYNPEFKALAIAGHEMRPRTFRIETKEIEGTPARHTAFLDPDSGVVSTLVSNPTDKPVQVRVRNLSGDFYDQILPPYGVAVVRWRAAPRILKRIPIESTIPSCQQ